MKRLFLFLVTLTLTTNLAFSGEVTGAGITARNILKRNNINLNDLEKNGHQLIYGDKMGPAKRVDLNRISMVLTQSQLYFMDEVEHIDFRYPSAARNLADVNFMEFYGKKIMVKQLAAMVFK